MSRSIIIGDVHGCLDELRELLEIAALNAGDKVVFVGDLVDKGPDPQGVIREAMVLEKRGLLGAVVRGNHEDKHERWRAHQRAHLATGAVNPVTDWRGEAEALARKLTNDEVKFIESARLFCRIPGGLVVHAGVSPHLRSLPEDPPRRAPRRDPLSTVSFIRYVTPSGSPVSLGSETQDDTYWAASYDGRFGHIYFGHQPFKSETPVEFSHATGLDLGCCYGRALAAAVLDGNGRLIEHVTVRARAIYAKSHLDGLPGFEDFSTP